MNKYIPLSKPYITRQEIDSVRSVLESGWLTTGPKVAEFENEFSRYIGGSIYSVALNSCTSGLFLCLKALGIGPGDEVILPTWTFVATAHVVLWAKAKVVLCDIDEDTFNMDLNKLTKLITKRTRAIIPVHFAGYPCDMDRLLELGRKKGITIIEDAAHASGSEYKGRKIGSFGDVAAFSFYATKNLTCGEGGMVVSGDRRFIERIRRLSYFGIDKRAFRRYGKSGSWFYDVKELGYKCNMDDIHAAIGIEQLKKLDSMNRRRSELADLYKCYLNKYVTFQPGSPDCYHNFHIFVIKIPGLKIGYNEFMRCLKSKNIGASLHFIPLHKFSFYKKELNKKSYPAADRLFGNVLSLPLCPSMREKDIKYISAIVNSLIVKNIPKGRL